MSKRISRLKARTKHVFRTDKSATPSKVPSAPPNPPSEDTPTTSGNMSIDQAHMHVNGSSPPPCLGINSSPLNHGEGRENIYTPPDRLPTGPPVSSKHVAWAGLRKLGNKLAECSVVFEPLKLACGQLYEVLAAIESEAELNREEEELKLELDDLCCIISEQIDNAGRPCERQEIRCDACLQLGENPSGNPFKTTTPASMAPVLATFARCFEETAAKIQIVNKKEETTRSFNTDLGPVTALARHGTEDNQGKFSRFYNASERSSANIRHYRQIKKLLNRLSLATYSLQLGAAISEELEKHPLVWNRELSQQFQVLIVTPLAKVKGALPIDPVIVIDALDECQDQIRVGDMLLDFLKHTSNLPVKLFMASRPEPRIVNCMSRKEFAEVHKRVNLHDIDRYSVWRDIKTYLSERLNYLDISESDMEKLVDQSGVLFIYGSTLVRYLSCTNRAHAMLRLRQILNLSVSIESESSRELDALYTEILRVGLDGKDKTSWEKNSTRAVLQAVAFSVRPLEIPDIGILLKMENEELVQAALDPLLSVLHISEKTGKITLLHQSFLEYLCDKQRSGEFHLDPLLQNSQYAKLCFDAIMSIGKPFNICALQSSFMADWKVQDLSSRKKQAISPLLLYASEHWEAHAALGNIHLVVDELDRFLSNGLLRWMEVMSLHGKINAAIEMLQSLELNLRKYDLKLQSFARDAWQFASSFESISMSTSTLHLYASILPLWPEDREISKCYQGRIRGLVKASGRATNKQNLAPETICKASGSVLCLTYSPDGVFIVSGLKDGNICICDTRTGHITQPLPRRHTKAIYSIVYSFSGNHFASGAEDGIVCVWGAYPNNPHYKIFDGHTYAVYSLSWSRDDLYLASGSQDGTIRILNVEDGTTHRRLILARSDIVTSVSYSPDSTAIAFGSPEGHVFIWDLKTGSTRGLIKDVHDGWVFKILYSPDGKVIASCSADGNVYIWDHQMTKRLAALDCSSSKVKCIAFSPDSRFLASGSDSGTVRIWNAKSYKPHGLSILCHRRRVWSVEFSPKSTHLASACDDGYILVHNLTSKMVDKELLAGYQHSVCSISCSPNSNNLVSGSSEHDICVWDTLGGKLYAQLLVGHEGHVNTVTYSVDGQRIASGSEDSTVRVWSSQNGQWECKVLLGHTDEVISVAWSADSAYIASGSKDLDVRLWDAVRCTANGPPLHGHHGTVRTVAFSPSESYIASGSDDRSVRVWNIKTGRLHSQPFVGHEGAVLTLVYSSDGSQIYSGSDDGTIKVWNSESGQVQCELQARSVIRAIAVSPNGAFIAFTYGDSAVCIWDVSNDDNMCQVFHGHRKEVTSLAYHYDGSQLMSGSKDGSIRIWDMDESKWSLVPSQEIGSWKLVPNITS
ncbi:WD repeat-containing protein [Ceratobasidium sp. AG-Ba]|nr:WD repeat-containing protein [Ceratobasidium sp. AG-Ba]